MIRLFCLLLIAMLTAPVASAQPATVTLDPYGGGKAVRKPADEFPRLSADFEATEYLVLSLGDWLPRHKEILARIAAKTTGHVRLMILCRDEDQMRTATDWLLQSRHWYEASGGYQDVYFCQMQSDTVWVRDFGPLFAQTRGGARVLDFFYEETRPLDDRLPKLWCDQTRCQHTPVGWKIQGGNLLSNGRGIALTTKRIFDDNPITLPASHRDRSAPEEAGKIVVDAITRACNLSQLVILEPLEHEMTRHVDLFATFVSPTDVLVARVAPEQDLANSQILERNAIRLSQVAVDGKPLVVHRIDIPPRVGTSWSAYNNVVIAGDLVLIPTYDRDPPQLVERAMATYRRLLPRHKIETFNVTAMEHLQGELHCLSLTVPDFVPMPKQIYSFEEVAQTK